MHKNPQNQSSVVSSGQTITTNVSMTPCNWQICHQNHVLCGCTTFCTELNLSIGKKLRGEREHSQSIKWLITKSFRSPPSPSNTQIG